jgi:hypoxanthine phosphoribosyltransferase
LVRHIAEADICLVDVTGQNPNVFFELGIRYGLRKSTTILLKQPDTIIPFDVANYRCVEYDPQFFGIQKAINELVETIQVVIARSPNISDSLVFEVYPELVVTIPGVIEERVEASEPRQMAWTEYWNRLAVIAESLKDLFQNGQYVPDVVFGISNGGLVYADLLGRLVFGGGTPILSLWADRPNREGNFFENAINDSIIDGIKRTAPPSKKSIQILLVDDIVASGNTLQQAIRYLNEKLPDAQVYFLPLFSRNPAPFERMKDVFLWSSPFFKLPEHEMMEKHASDKYWLPYRKELRST